MNNTISTSALSQAQSQTTPLSKTTASILNEYSVTHTADGLKNAFFYPYTNMYMDQIQVFVNSVLIDPYSPRNGYALNAHSALSGGFVVFTNLLPAGTKVMICDNVSFQKIVNFFASSSFTADDLNTEFDNIYKILGILNSNSFKTVRLNSSDSVLDLADLPDGVISKTGQNITTSPPLDAKGILAKLDDVSHKYDDLKGRLITAFNKISSAGGSGANVIQNALVSQNNLNDILDVKQARQNLGLGEIATISKITSAHTDNTIVSQNLANIDDPAEARRNLKLGDMATMSQSDLITLINKKLDDGFNIPILSTSVYGVNKDISPTISLIDSDYQQLPFSSHDAVSSLPTLLYASSDNLVLHVDMPGIFLLTGFISVHGVYNVVSKIEVRKKSDSTLISTMISNHVTSDPESSTPGLCMFNELISIQEAVSLTIFLKGDNSKNANLMLDTPLDNDYLSKFTLQRILT